MKSEIKMIGAENTKKVFEQDCKILKERDQFADGTTGWEMWCSLTLRSGGFIREKEIMVV